MRLPLFLLALVTLSAATLSARDAVVSRNVNLRNDPSTQNQEIRLLIPGEELFILSLTKQNNYYNVRTMANEVGWAYSPRIRLLPPPTRLFNGCPMEGNATRSDTQERNRLKNRTTAPQANDIDNAITLQAHCSRATAQSSPGGCSGTRTIGATPRTPIRALETIGEPPRGNCIR